VQNKKASILIWAIFLSLIISISFLSISTQITKNLKTSQSSQNIIEKQNQINNVLKNSQENKKIIWNTIIEMENKSFIKSLKKNEILKINFPQNSTIELKLLNSWIIFYNTWSSNTWILDNNTPNIETNIEQNKNLILKNYSWYTKIKLTSNNKFDLPEKKYKIIEYIWNKKVIKSLWILK